jgi:hypothetical protein
MNTPGSYPILNVSHVKSAVVKGGRMALIVQMRFESVVTEMYQDAFDGGGIYATALE